MNLLTLFLIFILKNFLRNLYFNCKVYLFDIGNFIKVSTHFIWLYLNNINKIKLILTIFIITYGIFFIILAYYLLLNYNNELKVVEYKSLTDIIKDSSLLLKDNFNQFNPHFIHSKDDIKNIYNVLGIINYQDFIYMKTYDSYQLNLICNNNQNIKDLLVNISINDMFGSHLELITDINRRFIKSLFKWGSPLIVAVVSITIISGYEILLNTPILI